MKTIITYLALVCTAFSISAQTTHLSEDFESGTFPPNGWVTYRGINDAGTAYDWTSSTIANSGNSSAFSRYSHSTAGIAEDWLVTPLIDLSNTSDSELYFFSKETYGTFYASQYDVRVSTSSQTNHSSFTAVATYNDFNTFNYEEFIVDLSAYDGQQIYIAFVHIDEFQDDWYLDDITITALMVSSFTIDNITYNTLPDNEVEVVSGCMNTVNIPETVSYNGITYNVVSIADAAFQGCTELVNLSIPSSIRSIGENAFRDCTNLTSIIIPDGITAISDGMFFGCSSLASVSLPETITLIGFTAFYNCSSLTSLTVPNSVYFIDNSAFYNCTSLTSITIPENVSVIRPYTFFGCSSISSFEIPSTVSRVYDFAFGSLNGLTDLTVNWNSPLSINANAFSETNISTIGLNVPSGSESLYENTPVWMDFNSTTGFPGCDISYIPSAFISNPTEFGQSFTAICSGNLEEVSLYIHYSSPGIIPANTLYIYDGNTISDTPIYAQDFPETIINIGNGYFKVVLSENLSVTQGQQYTFKMDIGSDVIAQGTGSNGYAGGNAFFDGVTNVNHDCGFAVSISDGGTLGMDDEKSINAVILFPNPTTDYITISGVNELKDYVIYDMTGKTVDAGSLESQERISVQQLEHGMYFVKFQNGASAKFIKK